MASTPRQTGTQSDHDRPSIVPGAVSPRPSLLPTAPSSQARASGMVLLPGTCGGPRLCWEGGVASHWPRGKHPRERAVGGTEVKEAQGVGRGSRPGPGRDTSHVPEGLSLGFSQAPGPATSVPLRPRGSVPCVPQEGTPPRRLCAPRSVQRKAWTPSFSHPPAPGARAWVSGDGWPLCSRSSPDILTGCGAVRPCFLGFQPPVVARQHFQIFPVHSADSSHPSALSHVYHFFPLLEFDSNSPKNRICTKAATPNLDLHTPLRFVLFLIALIKYTLCSQLGRLQRNDISTTPAPPLGFS